MYTELETALDTGFAPGTGPTNAAGVNASVQSLVLLPNGNVLVGGTFVQFNGVARGRVARLLPGGTLDTSYAAGTGNTVVTHQNPPDSSKGPSHALRRAFFD